MLLKKLYARGKGVTGFTLIEIMVTTAVLSVGLVFLYESFFVTLDAFSYYSHSLAVGPWMNEKVWEVQDALVHNAGGAPIGTSGELKTPERTFQWSLSYGLINEEQKLYKIGLTLGWKEGRKQFNLTRAAYATYKPQEEK
jgi:prepilin-type N-terminal cleavage/methylation domain-containing protein